jgi:tripartite-type tricarboxylate transporter receptor subunit TctC
VKCLVWSLCYCAALFHSVMAYGQNFPSRPLRIVCGETGGGTDFAARLIAPALSTAVGQPVIVDNRGGSGIISGEIVANAPADGHTMLFNGAAFWLLPFMNDKVPFHPLKDFSPVTLAVTQPTMLVVHPSFPVSTVKELIAMAKAEPGTLNYASGPAGSSSQLAAELFKAMAGVNIVRILYKGTGPALIDVIAGQVPLMFPNAAAGSPQVKAGKLRALAVTSAQPSALFPGLPTLAASGLPGYEAVSNTGFFAPAKTPAEIINRLNQEIARVLNRSDIKGKFFGAGVEVVGSSPQRFAEVVKSEMTVLGKVMKDAHVREE